MAAGFGSGPPRDPQCGQRLGTAAAAAPGRVPPAPAANPLRYTVSVPPGPGHALFFYIAGALADYAGQKAETTCYGTSGGPDWSPYYPPLPERVAAIAQQAVKDMGTVCYHLPMDRLLADRIEEAQANNNIVIVIVDPWTLRLSDYRKVLEGCDRRDYYNCAVLRARKSISVTNEVGVELYHQAQ